MVNLRHSKKGKIIGTNKDFKLGKYHMPKNHNFEHFYKKIAKKFSKFVIFGCKKSSTFEEIQ